MNETQIRLTSFAGVLAAMVLWENVSPRRPRSQDRPRRWFANLGLTAVDTLALRLTVGALAYEAAHVAQARDWGALALVDLPAWLEAVLAFVVLDLAIYVQHVLVHFVPLFWRFHRVHHTDIDLDATSGVRFHPVEIVGSMIAKAGLVLAIGATPVAVLVFEVVLNATALFNHGNVRLPGPVDRVVRLVLVTPDMHRVHHSVDRSETDSNFGFNLSVWDRLCGTYRAAPARGQLGMDIGLPDERSPERLGLWRLLLQPFERAR